MQDKIFLNSHYAFRADTLENWQRENPILENGEPSVVSDGNDGEWLKIGDGVTPWNDLKYRQGPQGKPGADGSVISKKVFERIATITVAPDTDGSLPQYINFTEDKDGVPLELESFYVNMVAGMTDGAESSFCANINNVNVLSNAPVGFAKDVQRGASFRFRKNYDGFIQCNMSCAADPVVLKYWQGDGTEDSPYQITNADQLWCAVNNTDATKHFKIMNDINVNDISDFDSWDDKSDYTDWAPNATFVGTFNGNQKTISGLYASGSYKYLGLFSRVGKDAHIYDVIIDHAYLSTTAGSMSAVGGLIGTAHNTDGVYIYGCIVKNSKILNRHIGEAGEGGLVGAAYATTSSPCTITLENCYAVDNILGGKCAWSAGLMAARWVSQSVMINCFTTDYSLEHQPQRAIATNCYVSGNVERPFSYDSNAQFGDTTGIYKIDNDKMKGEEALANMQLSSEKWVVVNNDYPLPIPYIDSSEEDVSYLADGFSINGQAHISAETLISPPDTKTFETVTKISLYTESGNNKTWVNGSYFELWGVKK